METKYKYLNNINVIKITKAKQTSKNNTTKNKCWFKILINSKCNNNNNLFHTDTNIKLEGEELQINTNLKCL